MKEKTSYFITSKLQTNFLSEELDGNNNGGNTGGNNDGGNGNPQKISEEDLFLA